MDNLYILMIGALVILAVFDIIVGVSNDAVNFLNSAIGSKVISFRTIMIIASLGIFIGAVYSGGLMEVARKGIFVPGQFTFEEIMVICMAVMIADILLLDFFNTLGLPTSTTVSIVFNLLGAAVVMAIIKITANSDQSMEDIWTYINSEKALSIISGILLSVVIAFSVGAIVQFISRLIFTFNYERKIKNFGAIFGGVALAAITYFIFMKGLKGTPQYKDIKGILEGNEMYIMIGSFVFWTLFSYAFEKIFKKTVLIVVIGVGTFGLALAFSGNDLVNFIGVPMLGWHSYELWSASGVPAAEFLMGDLDKKVPAEPFILFIAGAIMVVTLWTSKKARTVADTEIGLSRQDEGKEKFKPNALSRAVVKGTTYINSGISAILPKGTLANLNSRFEKPVVDLPRSKSYELPAFDMIRASINLVVAGILISIATSMKLPLSTTYVTFMVAMGTSLADRAWGRESAVYRVAGVLNVIGGWFFTAFSAFCAAGTLAFLIHLGGPTGRFAVVAILLIVAAALLVRNYLSHKKNSALAKEESNLSRAESQTIQGIIEESADNIAKTVSRTNKIYTNVLKGLAKGKVGSLKKSRAGVEKLNDEIDELRGNIFYFIKNLEETSVRGSNFYIQILGYLEDITQSLEYIAKASYKHVNNNHKPLRFNQIRDLQEINKKLNEFLSATEMAFKDRNYAQIGDLLGQKEELYNNVTEKIQKQVARTRSEESSPKNTTLYFGLLLETKDLIEEIMNLLDLYHNEHQQS
ncbi:inorganic phosphate transporter [Dokdonia sp.]|uniref:inorganic phosphate transporter n=1 Tax=Dokdonia sp. TaxID=2024995 RepID=UPI0032664FC6